MHRSKRKDKKKNRSEPMKWNCWKTDGKHNLKIVMHLWESKYCSKEIFLHYKTWFLLCILIEEQAGHY